MPCHVHPRLAQDLTIMCMPLMKAALTPFSAIGAVSKLMGGGKDKSKKADAPRPGTAAYHNQPGVIGPSPSYGGGY